MCTIKAHGTPHASADATWSALAQGTSKKTGHGCTSCPASMMPLKSQPLSTASSPSNKLTSLHECTNPMHSDLVAPRLLRIATDVLQQTEVPADTIVPEVPTPLQAEHLALVFQRCVTMEATPPPPRLLGATEPLPGCSACDHPNTPARLRPVMGQSQKVACAVPIGRRLAGVRFPERDQRRLRRMNAQINAGKPLRQHGHNLPGIGFQLAAHDTLIGNAQPEASALPPWPDFTRTPCLQHMMADSIGQPR
jgi:hypothetical protein